MNEEGKKTISHSTPANMNYVEKHILPNLHDLKYKTLIGTNFTVTVIELVGAFITGDTGPGTTSDNFEALMRCKYMPDEYNQPAGLIYNNIWDGVTHSFVPKGSILPSKYDRYIHFEEIDDGLCINVPQLCENVAAVMTLLMRNIRNNKKLRVNYNNVHEEINNTGEEVYPQYLEDK